MEDLYEDKWKEKKNQWNTLFKKLNGIEWIEEKSEDPGSVRENLDRVYLVS